MTVPVLLGTSLFIPVKDDFKINSPFSDLRGFLTIIPRKKLLQWCERDKISAGHENKHLTPLRISVYRNVFTILWF